MKGKFLVISKTLLVVFILVWNGISMGDERIFSEYLIDTNGNLLLTLENSPIIIDSDQDFNNYNLTGDGSPTSPYLITNLNISTNDEYGIKISSTTKYFIIYNCEITAKDYGIYISNVESETAQIINNVCDGAQIDGIFVQNTLFATITSNICKNNGKFGIHLIASTYSIINYNSLYNCGLMVEEFLEENYCTYLIDSNTVNDLPLGYLTNLTNTNIITPFGQLILVNISEVTISNQECSFASIGIALIYSSNVNVTNNVLSNNSMYGIYVYSSQYIELSNNICFNNTVGIKTSSCGSLNVINNTCQYNWEGIQVIDTLTVKLNKNTCTGNWWSGVFISDSNDSFAEQNELFNNTYGIFLQNSDYSNVVNNVIKYNSWGGLYIAYSKSSVITNNSLICDGLFIIEYELEGYMSHTIKNNTVNGLPLGFLSNLVGHSINESYGQLYLINSTQVEIRGQNCSFTNVGISLLYSQNCSIVNTICSYNGYVGIYILESPSTILINNTCSNNDYNGVLMYFSESSRLESINCANNKNHGAVVMFSDSTFIENSSFTNNLNCGLKVEYVYNSIITNNLFASNNETGLRIVYSDYSVVINNTSTNNKNYGMYLRSCSSSTVVSNVFYGDGLFIGQEFSVEEYLSYVIKDNIVNNMPFGYFYDLFNTTIEGQYGQIFLVNCSKVLINNQNFSNTSTGLTLAYSLNCQISDNVFANIKEDALYIFYSPNSFISNNSFTNNKRVMFMLGAPFSIFENNECENSLEDIFLSSSQSIEVIANTFVNCINKGIHLISCSFANIERNEFRNNSIGLLVASSRNVSIFNNSYIENEWGIYLSTSYFSTIVSNSFVNNFGGIKISSSDNCLVFYNLVTNCIDYGLILNEYADNNVIYNNDFVENKWLGTSQAYDDGVNNTWYNITLLEGNYWSDWSGVGNYSIDGIARNVDPYPSHLPYTFNIDSTNRKLYLLILLAIPIAVLPIVYFSYKKRKFWFFK